MTSFNGKLFVCGEYAAVYGRPSIIMEVKQSMYTQITELNQSGFIIDTDFLSESVYVSTFSEIEGMKHLKAALMTAQDYLLSRNIKIKPFRLTMRSELKLEQLKLGFGSSGVVMVAAISTVLNFHECEIDLMQLYKLSYLSGLSIGEMGSGGDLASAAYGGWIYYIAPDRKWVTQQKSTHDIDIMIDKEWKNLKIESIPAYSQEVLVGFSGNSHTTDASLKLISDYRLNNEEEFDAMLDRAEKITMKAYLGLINKDEIVFLQSIDHYRQWMLELEERSGCLIETTRLKYLIESANQLGMHAKVSGAGGGDCGIAFGLMNKDIVYRKWMDKGIIPIEIKENKHGS